MNTNWCSRSLQVAIILLVMFRGGVQTTSGQDKQTNFDVVTVELNAGAIRSVAFSPDGKRLATGCHDQTVKLLNTTAGQELVTLSGHARTVMSVAFSPDGKRIASVDAGSVVKIWDLQSRFSKE